MRQSKKIISLIDNYKEQSINTLVNSFPLLSEAAA